MLKKAYISVIILCGLQIYELSILGTYTKILHLAGIGLIFFLIVLYGIYDTSPRFKSNFTIFVIFMLISLPTSMYIANTEYNQPVKLSLLSQRHMFYYFMYFAAHALKTKPRDIERVFLFFGFMFIILYLMQMILYPHKIFNVTMFKERGTIRIFLPGITFMVISFFYSLQDFLEKNNIKYLIFNLLSFSVIILIGGRSLLFVVLLVTIINLLFSKKIKSKVIIYALSIVGGIILIFIFRNIFMQLFEVTEQTREAGLNNIRIRAIVFYFNKLFPNGISYIFGNGVASGKSEFGHRIFSYSEEYGFYLSDIGIIGNYINYGLFFVIGVFGMLWKIFKIKIDSSCQYLKYFFIVILLSLPTGGGFSDSELIIAVCLSLYIIDVSSYFHRNLQEVKK